MSSGQSLRNGSSVEPGLPNTFLMPKPRNSSSVACLTVSEVAFFGGIAAVSFTVIARSQRVRAKRGPMTGSATKQSRATRVALDCFAPLAMTGAKALPRRRALHCGLPRIIRGPQLHGRAVVVGVDRELAAFEQRLHAAVAEFLRRLAAQLCGHLHQESGLQRPVEDQPWIAFDLGDVIAVVMNAVAVEG